MVSSAYPGNIDSWGTMKIFKGTDEQLPITPSDLWTRRIRGQAAQEEVESTSLLHIITRCASRICGSWVDSPDGKPQHEQSVQPVDYILDYTANGGPFVKQITAERQTTLHIPHSSTSSDHETTLHIRRSPTSVKPGRSGSVTQL